MRLKRRKNKSLEPTASFFMQLFIYLFFFICLNFFVLFRRKQFRMFFPFQVCLYYYLLPIAKFIYL